MIERHVFSIHKNLDKLYISKQNLEETKERSNINYGVSGRNWNLIEVII